MPTTLGREIVRSKLPDKYKSYADKVLDKKTTTELMTALAKEDPDRYVDILQDLNNFGQSVVSIYGRDAALPFRDMKISKEIRHLNEKMRAVIDNVLNDDSLTDAQKEEKIKQLGYKYTQKVEDAVFDDHNKRQTALASQINSGSRGNKTQLRQMMFGNMLMKDALNRDMPYLAVDPYSDGVSPMAYWVSSSSGRKGYYDVQAATGQSGYLGKRVTAATHDTIISEFDCGTTDTGVPFPANSSKNVGAVLLKPFHNYPAGTIVTPKMVAEANDDEMMLLRSPMTCKSADGVCAVCNGLDENGRFPGVGEYVSLNAARSFVEPLTQGAIGCLHPLTQVRMANGTVRYIQDLDPGDMILGVDMNGKVTPAQVIRTYDQGEKDLYSFTFEKDGRSVELICTKPHRMLAATPEDEAPLSESKITEAGEEARYFYAVCTTGRAKKKPKTRSLWRRTRMCFYSKGPAVDIEVDCPTHLFLLANGLVVSNSKHTGGVGGKKVENPEGEDQPTGFRAIERMFTTPSNFPGAAVLAPEDGTITEIRPAPQGGTYVTVGNKTLYCSPYRKVKVKNGDKVYAGDVLTNGVPNPLEVVSLKGLGAGRVYFMNKLNDILNAGGVGTDRRNLESFTRAMINKVEVTDPDGYDDFLPGDIVNYSHVMAGYEPREDSTEMPVEQASNKYLEKPVLYYSIGTRITPEVASELKKYKFDKVLVNDKAPSFAARFMRPAEGLQHDRHWLPRLSGERLKEGLFDATRQGLTDPYDSPSYVDKIVIGPLKPSANN